VKKSLMFGKLRFISTWKKWRFKLFYDFGNPDQWNISLGHCKKIAKTCTPISSKHLNRLTALLRATKIFQKESKLLQKSRRKGRKAQGMAKKNLSFRCFSRFFNWNISII
jgi:hypothetical protein